MTIQENSFTIKPVVHKNFYKRVFFLISITLILILAAAFNDGEFDRGLFIFEAVVFSIVYYCIFRFEYRTIVVDEDCYTYRGFTKKIRVEYKNIEGIDIIEKEISKRKTYSLLVAEGTEKYYWQISDIQKYRRKKIEELIIRIGERSNTPNTELTRVKGKLDSVNWLHD